MWLGHDCQMGIRGHATGPPSSVMNSRRASASEAWNIGATGSTRVHQLKPDVFGAQRLQLGALNGCEFRHVVGQSVAPSPFCARASPPAPPSPLDLKGILMPQSPRGSAPLRPRHRFERTADPCPGGALVMNEAVLNKL